MFSAGETIVFSTQLTMQHSHQLVCLQLEFPRCIQCSRRNLLFCTHNVISFRVSWNISGAGGSTAGTRPERTGAISQHIRHQRLMANRGLSIVDYSVFEARTFGRALS